VAPLEAAGLRRAYGRLVALAGLDLTVAAGECVALVGANGSGKSTAVRAIAGLLEPSAGTVRLCGHDPHREPDAEAARAVVRMVAVRRGRHRGCAARARRLRCVGSGRRPDPCGRCGPDLARRARRRSGVVPVTPRSR
jgi:ABC-type Mn2+/Zn2+ transport system ATPase subunit